MIQMLFLMFVLVVFFWSFGHNKIAIKKRAATSTAIAMLLFILKLLNVVFVYVGPQWIRLYASKRPLFPLIIFNF